MRPVTVPLLVGLATVVSELPVTALLMEQIVALLPMQNSLELVADTGELTLQDMVTWVAAEVPTEEGWLGAEGATPTKKATT